MALEFRGKPSRFECLDVAVLDLSTPSQCNIGPWGQIGEAFQVC